MFDFWPFNIARKRREALEKAEAMLRGRAAEPVEAPQEAYERIATGYRDVEARRERERVAALRNGGAPANLRTRERRPAAPPVPPVPVSRSSSSPAPAPSPVYDNWPYPSPAWPYASPSPEADCFRGAGGTFDGGGASGGWSSSSSSSSDSGCSSSDPGSSSSGSD